MPRVSSENYVLIAITIVLALLGLFMYASYHDILIPGLPDGSYRELVGAYYIVPAGILLGGQLLISSIVLHSFSIMYGKKSHYVKALTVAALITFLFSATYAIFPFVGPFYYIISFAGKGPSYALPVEIIWTGLTLLVSTIAMHKLYHLSPKRSIGPVLLVYIFLITAAS